MPIAMKIHETHKGTISAPAAERLMLLAMYLYNLPDDYKHFDINDYVSINQNNRNEWIEANSLTPEQLEKAIEACGSSACAVGHAPTLTGIDPTFKLKRNEEWGNYSKRVFKLDHMSMEWRWCFSDSWHEDDNTPKGAAQRIKYMLKNGVPEDFTFYGIGMDKAIELYEDEKILMSDF